MDIEEHLKNALRRESPHSGFTQRVIARVNRGPRTEDRGRFRWRAVAAVLTLTVLVGAWTAHQIAERREGERARDEVMLALHIAGAKVHYAQTQVHEIGSKHVKESR
jgi:hypothetical protein